MPAPLNVDREAVRVLAVAVGVREAARQMGLEEETVMSWSKRFGWMTEKAAALERVPVGKGVNGFTVVPARARTASEAMAEAMENLSTETKLGFARASAKVAQRLAETDAEQLVDAKQAIAAKAWVQTAQVAHGWAGAGGTTVNVAVALRLDMDE